MKLTMVIDTEDMLGIEDAYKIASMFYVRYHTSASLNVGQKVSYGKVAHVKMLREHAKAVIAAHQSGQDPTSLRFNKWAADEIFLRDAAMKKKA